MNSCVMISTLSGKIILFFQARRGKGVKCNNGVYWTQCPGNNMLHYFENSMNISGHERHDFFLMYVYPDRNVNTASF